MTQVETWFWWAHVQERTREGSRLVDPAIPHGTYMADYGRSSPPIALAEGNGVGQQFVPEKRMATFEVDKNRVAAFCRRNRIRRLALFGSVLRDDFAPDSDIDVLVEFEDGHIPGLAFFAMEQELTQILGRQVDLNTPQFLSRHFRDTVLAEAEDQYAA